jgi:nucleoside-specific outer membrane channel protein Tsx
MTLVLRASGAALATALAVSPANADDLLQWRSENVQVLHGSDYELGDLDRTIVTLEHANSWTYGDTFAFADLTFADDNSFYGELSPRLSLSRISGRHLSWGPIKDVLVAGTYEFGDEGYEAYLIGAAVDLNIPGFTFVGLHAYHRDDPALPGSTWQATITWHRPFEIAGQHFVIEGFADLAGEEGPSAENQLIVPQLLWRVPLGGEESPLYFGIEHQYWNNKFGIEGVEESVTQLELKWVLH